jgi:hypothetical protein
MDKIPEIDLMLPLLGSSYDNPAEDCDAISKYNFY